MNAQRLIYSSNLQRKHFMSINENKRRIFTALVTIEMNNFYVSFSLNKTYNEIGDVTKIYYQ